MTESDQWLPAPYAAANDDRMSDLERAYGGHVAFMEAAMMMEEMSAPRTPAQRAARRLQIREADEQAFLDQMARD